jgi:hypothetical protein
MPPAATDNMGCGYRYGGLVHCMSEKRPDRNMPTRIALWRHLDGRHR